MPGPFDPFEAELSAKDGFEPSPLAREGMVSGRGASFFFNFLVRNAPALSAGFGPELRMPSPSRLAPLSTASMFSIAVAHVDGIELRLIITRTTPFSEIPALVQ